MHRPSSTVADVILAHHYAEGILYCTQGTGTLNTSSVVLMEVVRRIDVNENTLGTRIHNDVYSCNSAGHSIYWAY